MTHEELKAAFDYDPQIGRFIRKTFQSANGKPGDVVRGYLGDKGRNGDFLRLIFCHNKKIHNYAKHIFLWHHGHYPKAIIHLNGKYTDLRIGNLVDRRSRKSVKRKDNKSGVKNVNFHKAHNCWTAKIVRNGKRYQKYSKDKSVVEAFARSFNSLG